MLTYTFRAEHQKLNRGDKRQPYVINIEIPEPQSLVEKRTQEFIIHTTVEKKCYKLLPFVFGSDIMMKVGKHYLLQRNGSHSALFTQISAIFHFCKWMKKEPDKLIEECRSKLAEENSELFVQSLRNKVDEYIFSMKDRKLSPTSINKALYSIRIFFRINDIYLKINFKVQRRALYSCRSITIDELQKILSVANLREKIIIGILAVSGIRTGPLVKLKYRHVKHDLENGITPLHLAIESQITKGGFGYSTFLNNEVTEFLKQYLDERRKGSKRIKPEIIDDESPLIKMLYRKERADPMTTQEVGYLLRKLFFMSGILTKKPKTNAFGYEIGANSFRKFFRTEMAMLGVERHFIEYMMGHKRDRYLDVKMVGIEYLRRVYNLSGISIRPTNDDNLVLLKRSIERLGYDPNEILKPEFLQALH